MTRKDAVGITCTATGLLLVALGRPLLGPRGPLCGVALLVIGLLLIYLAKRQRQIDDTLDDLSASSDGDYLLGSHDLTEGD